MSSGIAEGLWSAFLDYLYRTSEISVPADFQSRCAGVYQILDNDISGVVSTVIDYSINSAAEAELKVECSDEKLEELLTIWLEKININIEGVPAGIKELAKEYYKERWAGSSLCLMRVSNWEKITVNNNSITVPTVLWFVNGASVYIKRENEKNFKLGSDKYFLDENLKNQLPSKKEEYIFIQKPFGRWFSKYPSPYLIKKGVYKNWRAMEVLQDKADEVIAKVLPYLFMITKGDKDLFLQKDVEYTDTELQELVNKFKLAIQRYNAEKANVPTTAVPFDQKYEHLIPDLRNILSEELYHQGYRAVLSGLGFVSIVQGVGDTRKEEVINPKPFVTEVNAGVDGFKSMLMDVIRLIITQNKLEHRKLFSDKNYLKIVNSPLKINVQSIIDQLRSSYIYGAISIATYQEILGIDPEQELERMKKEQADGLRDIFYPHLIQNVERDPDMNVSPITKKQVEKQKDKEKAVTQEELVIAPYQSISDLPDAVKKYPQKAQEVFLNVFNSVLEQTKDEARAFAAAWSQLKKWMKRHADKQKAQEESKKLDENIKIKKDKLLNKLLGEKDEVI